MTSMPRPLLGGDTAVTVHTAHSATQTTGHFYKYDHLQGGVLYLREDAVPITGVDVQLDFAQLHLTR